MAARKPRLVSIDELARYLGISRLSVYRMIWEGLPGYRVGSGRGQRRYDLDEVLRWCKAREERERLNSTALDSRAV